MAKRSESTATKTKERKTAKLQEGKTADTQESKTANPREKENVDVKHHFVSHFKPTLVEASYLSKPLHLQTRNDRYELGRALRLKCSRESQAEYRPNRSDRDDPIEVLIASSEGRIPELLPIRYGRMVTSPFAFYRGAASIMAADLASTPSTNYAVQSCGDCHLMNFGAFATPERNIIFDMNDFDETFPATWEWDLKRLAASFVIASLHNRHKLKDAKAAAFQAALTYGEKMRELAEMKTLDAWYSYLDYEELIEQTDCKKLKKLRKSVLKKAISRSASDELVKLACMKGEKPRIKDQPPLIYHDVDYDSPEYQERIAHSITGYRNSLSLHRRVLFDKYELADIALKVVGVGSVGTYCHVALFFAAEQDPLFLQIKEARTSVLENYSGFLNLLSNGERVVAGQRLMQAASDFFLGHFIGASGRHYYVRQLRDVKVKPLVAIFNPEHMRGFARNCAWALARAHARSGDSAIIAGYIGKGAVFAEAISQFAAAYAEQNLEDYERLREAVRDGKIEIVTEEG
jgi:uncharacterized protein (DUF2252 family)